MSTQYEADPAGHTDRMYTRQLPLEEQQALEFAQWRQRKYDQWMTAVDEQIGLRSQGKFTVDNVPRMNFPQVFDEQLSEWQAGEKAIRLINEYGAINMEEQST